MTKKKAKTSETKQNTLEKGLPAVAAVAAKLRQHEVTYVPIESLKPNDYNPNRQDEATFDLLGQSMQEDGFTQPILASKDGIIIDGEHRWRRARKDGLTEIPVVFTDLTRAEMLVETMRFNRTRGAEDQELAAQVLRDIRDLGAIDWATHALGLTTTEVDNLINDVGAAAQLAGADYSEAWTPQKDKTAESRDVKDGRVEMSPGAVALNQQLQTRIDQETDPNARKQLESQRRQSIYRVNMVFTPEQAARVKLALGDQPAQRLLTYAQAWQAVNA